MIFLNLNYFSTNLAFNNYKIKYSKKNVPISENNVYLLQLLDALRDIRKIPDATVNQSFTNLLGKIRQLTTAQQKQLLELAETYNPATRALIGALFENYIPKVNARKMKASLNSLTQYQIGIEKKLLPNQSDWNIK